MIDSRAALNLAYPFLEKKNIYIWFTYVDGLSENIAQYFTTKYEFLVSFETINSSGNLIKPFA